ncbi:MAG: hypothetical protein ACI8RZ_000415 [Myxococcota bacterium]|jgi:hypothetical protein
MTIDLTSITRKAIALLAIGAVGAAYIGGASAGLGFILGGLLMMSSFGVGWWLSRPAADGTVSPHSLGRVAGLTAIKFPVIGGIAWVLFTNFHPVAVALGGMVFAFSISLDAWLNRLTNLTSTANTTGVT